MIFLILINEALVREPLQPFKVYLIFLGFRVLGRCRLGRRWGGGIKTGSVWWMREHFYCTSAARAHYYAHDLSELREDLLDLR